MNSTLVLAEAITFAVLIGVFFLFFKLMRRRFGTRGGAAEELDRRYSSGEISREEYLRIRDDISRE